MEKYKLLMEINRRLFVGEDISPVEKEDAVAVFLNGVCDKELLDLLRRGWITGKLSNGKISGGDTYNLLGKYIIRNAIGILPEYKDVTKYEIFLMWCRKKANGGLPVSLWDTYSAFANCYGGVIFRSIS